MSRFRIVLAAIAIAAAAAACASSAAPASQSGTAATPAAPASTAPTSAPSVPAIASASPATAPSVSLTEWKVVVTGTIKSGKTDLAIKDIGVASHELLVFKSDLAASSYPLDKAGNIIEEGAGVSLVSDGENIDAGGTQTRTIDLAPGKYLFVCNIPGHFKQGMFAVVTVAP
jgi:uncharacterized cupredoxin-like copper-binding protein